MSYSFAGLTSGGWVTYSITVVIIMIIYNAFLHPLSKVPGPFFARVSGLPSWYSAMSGDRHIWLWQLFQIYGPKVRITPNTVVFCDPVAYRDIYSNKANGPKGPFYEAWQKDEYDVNTFSTREKKVHACRRKMLNQSFTEQSLLASQPFMVKHVDRWIELLLLGTQDGEWSEPMNFADLSDTLVFDIMGDLCFGTSFNIKEPGENPFRVIPHSVVQYMQFFYPLKPQLTGYTYLRACIDETMRLSPSGPSELPRQVLKGGTIINGDFYPEGTIVGASGWATGHNEGVYGDAEVFRPERWIPDEGTGVTQEEVNILRANFHPFAKGPGYCPGKNIAILELSITIARMLHRLEVRKPPTGENSLGEGNPNGGWGKRNKNIFQIQDSYISVRNGPMVQFKKRRV
ncbi:hypothetical protein HYFRA_00007474 [Hymenoscyphus fraxineus]|uniref:Uncharacterized protein n=1 Tax=Hymenoscyphus fraxineus TaxID=746836 RepID=A0A9N9KR88_9HELO|nr:hypothetical protein HYFRA_00007474 [Hymenoscyphus fraxineus]